MTFTEHRRLLTRMIVVNIVNTVAYRADFVMFMLGTILSPVISLLVWRAAIANGAELPISETYLTSYFVVLAVVSMLTSAWLSGFLASAIRNGGLSVWLARPGSFLYELAANNISEKTFKCMVLLPMVVIFGFIFRAQVSLSTSALHWVLCLVSVTLGAVMFFCLDVMEGSLAFWLEEVSGIVAVRHLLMLVLAGQLVPLALMPDWAQAFLFFQPFRYLLSFPIELVVADLNRAEITLGLTVQVAWTVALVLGSRWVWGRGQRAYSAVGA
ncbi:MAG TPA: ABC-2 family transporter protein [Thermomicrobiales bacterium]|nr:ABC-2 family transporter protein [Thermomicrobiales bacterium]